MNCCLQNPVNPLPRENEPSAWHWIRRDAISATYFEYIGHASLVVIGPYSGKRYHFPGPGAKLEIDPRDRTALLAVPVIRPVSAN